MKNLLQWLRKFYPEAVTPELIEYCNNPEKHFTGIFSLKYCFTRIEKAGKYDMKSVFRQIAENLKIYAKDPRTDQIDMLPVFRNHPEIREKFKFDITGLEMFEIAGYDCIVNDTEHNLTSKIFRELPNIECIVFQNPETKAWGLVFKQTGKMIKNQEAISEIYKHIAYNYNFHASEKNGKINLIMNGGPAYDMEPGDMNITQLIEILERYFYDK